MMQAWWQTLFFLCSIPCVVYYCHYFDMIYRYGNKGHEANQGSVEYFSNTVYTMID